LCDIAVSVKESDIAVSLVSRPKGYLAEKRKQLWKAILEWAKELRRKERETFRAILKATKEDRASKAAIFARENLGERMNYLPVQITSRESALTFLERIYTMTSSLPLSTANLSKVDNKEDNLDMELFNEKVKDSLILTLFLSYIHTLSIEPLSHIYIPSL
jgi:hypothetical protein